MEPVGSPTDSGPARPRGIARVRQVGAQWTGLFALALLLLSAWYFVEMWVSAYRSGAAPLGKWGEYEGNHGPWRHIYGLRSTWYRVLAAQSLALFVALISLTLRPGRRAAIIAGLALGAAILFIATHYWLVD